MRIHTFIYAQESSSDGQKRSIQMNGYLKDLHAFTYEKAKDFTNVNLIHNRLNFRYHASQRFTWGLELRNRIFWGSEPQILPGFSSSLKNPDELIDLSINWIDNSRMIFNTTIDRLWFQFIDKNFEARLGRQRINWGIGTIWNPNDIFNTYNFLDFDYEERPGRDAIKLTYLFSAMSNFEFAATSSRELKNTVLAVKYFFNKDNYDVQFIGGLFQENITLGAGWSGSIGDIGFKGEIQYFAAHKETESLINFTMEADYLFAKSWYINGGVLFNSEGSIESVDFLDISSFRFSPKNLMPTKWNTTLTISKEFSPLFSGSLSSIFAPGTNLLILLPNLKYNLFTNFDIDLVAQSFCAERQEAFIGITHFIFLRGKWSF